MDGDGQWYLHLFAPEQPDLNWEHPEVRSDFEQTMRFWLDRGVDGFRIDVAHGIAKPTDLPDMDLRAAGTVGSLEYLDPRFDNDEVHEVHAMIRAVLDEYPGTMAVGEIWTFDDERFARYLEPGRLHIGFNFRLALTHFDADLMRAAIERSLAVPAKVGAPPTWTLSNHDIRRGAHRPEGARRRRGWRARRCAGTTAVGGRHACSTPRRLRWTCRRANCCSAATSWWAACSHRIPPPGWSERERGLRCAQNSNGSRACLRRSTAP